MGRRMKVVAWVLAFSASFAVGAVIAAHSDPFPPGVTDPGATPTATVTPSTSGAGELTGTLHLQSAHYLYVGGACRTNWQGDLSILEGANGTLSGTGAIHLVGKLHCDFAVLQAQTKTVNVSISGSIKGSRVTLSLAEAGRDPKGSGDFGGFTHTLRFLKLSVPISGSQQVHAARSDGDRGTYTSTGTFTATCVTNCSKS